MVKEELNVLGVAGTLGGGSATATVLAEILRRLETKGCEVDRIDWERDPIGWFNPASLDKTENFRSLQNRVQRADVCILATPDYHGAMSGVMKNFLDHFWREFAGKLWVTVVASNEKGLTVTDQLRTVARQCYGWTLPYGVAFSKQEDLNEGGWSKRLENRVEMMIYDICTYGGLLARQRKADIGMEGCGFMANVAV